MIYNFPDATPPVAVFTQEGGDPASRPVVLVGHGFAGSTAIMRGFALTLAHAGYTAIVWDFDGHGSNPQPFPSGWTAERGALMTDAEQALQVAVENGLANPEQVTILGHSMGSGVALTYGQKHPETRATVAVSPVNQPVTPDLPRNLLLMAGTAEPSFLENAQELIAEAGGSGGDPETGAARLLVPIQGANHITILFSPTAHNTSRAWLDATFGPQPGAKAYQDTRIWWYLVGVAGTLMVAGALASHLAQRIPEEVVSRPLWRRVGALTLGALLATLVLWLLQLAGLSMGRAFGLLVGGYLLIWFGVAGLISLALAGIRPEKLTWWSLLGGGVTFTMLWLGVGLLGSLVWEPWLLIPRRLILWPLGSLLMLPWFLALGQFLRGAGWLGQAGWWLVECLAAAGGLLLAMRLNPGIGFLALILPVFPLIFALHSLANAPYRGGWPFALSGAAFASWMLLVVFPLA